MLKFVFAKNLDKIINLKWELKGFLKIKSRIINL